MPALGHTVRDACIFCRAHLNWWPSDIPADWLVITEADWRALADADSTELDPVAFAADVTPERSHAAIATAGLRCDGLGHVEVVDHRPIPAGSSGAWSSSARSGRRAWWSSTTPGPAGALIAPLEAAEVEVIRPTAKARAAADGGFYDAVAERPCPMPPDRPWTPRLPAPRPARWGRLGLGPQGLSTDSTPLVAVSLARWGHATRAHLHNREPNIYI